MKGGGLRIRLQVDKAGVIGQYVQRIAGGVSAAGHQRSVQEALLIDGQAAAVAVYRLRLIAAEYVHIIFVIIQHVHHNLPSDF